MEAHLKICLYNPVNCPIQFCEEQNSLSNLTEHFKVAHNFDTTRTITQTKIDRTLTILGKDLNETVTDIAWPESHLTMNQQNFFSQTRRNPEGQWFCWVFVLGSEDEAKKYLYTISLTSDDKVNETCTRETFKLIAGFFHFFPERKFDFK